MIARSKTIDRYLVLLLAAEAALFSPAFGGYFYGDSAALLYLRPRGLTAAIRVFAELSPTAGGWYRPFSQWFLSYLLFPAFKTHFALYHAVALLLHLLVSAVLYRGLRQVCGSRPAAFAGAVFFGLHPVNFYATYDNAFFAETCLALAYGLSLAAFFRRRFAGAAAWFALALVSKESAVTLPVLLAGLFTITPELRRQWRGYARGFVPMAVLLFIYLAAYSRHFVLRAGTLTSAARSDYVLSLDGAIARNMLRYIRWTFQIPDGWVTGAWQFAPPFSYFSYALMVALGAWAAWSLARGGRLARIGLLWFLVTALPVLALNRYLLHHLYLPLAGIGLVVAAAFAFLDQNVRRPVTVSVLGCFCVAYAWLSYTNVRAEARGSWVATNAAVCRNAAQFLENHAAEIGPSSVVYVLNESGEPLDFAYQKGDLFRFLTSLDTLEVKFVPDRNQLPKAPSRHVLVARYERGQLFDVAGASGADAVRAADNTIHITAAGVLTWKAPGGGRVFVSVDGGPEKLVAEYPEGRMRPDWLVPGHVYRFTLRAAGAGESARLLDSVTYRPTMRSSLHPMPY